MIQRERFVAYIEGLLGKPVLWGQKGPDVFDCSGMVTHALKLCGGDDLRFTHNAQALHNATRLLLPDEAAEPGDLAFYGRDAHGIVHVAVVDTFGGVISADGAMSSITKLSVAMANPGNRVRRHNTVRYRKDQPFVVVHRNTLVDALDLITR